MREGVAEQAASSIGRIAYDAQGDLRPPQIYIFQVGGGEFVQVYPE